MRTLNPIPTKRELEILNLLAQGLTSDEVGMNLDPCISTRTVEAHKANVMNRLQAKNSVHLVSICYQQGILKA